MIDRSNKRNLRWLLALSCAVMVLGLSSAEVLARVGGGGSYGGGGSHGGGGGGAGALIYLLIRFLLWLTIEHPFIGIPVDFVVIGLLVYWFARPSTKTVAVASSSALGISGAAAPERRQDFQRDLNQLRRFDPNFSEIIFTDFCYALYGRAHEARGKGKAALDELSPYLSDATRTSLMQLNSPQVKAVQGVIVGAMQVVDMRGLASPKVEIRIEYEANYTEFSPQDDPRGEMS